MLEVEPVFLVQLRFELSVVLELADGTCSFLVGRLKSRLQACLGLGESYFDEWYPVLPFSKLEVQREGEVVLPGD